MLTSMTGFGRAETLLPPAGRAVVEIHTLNHRFLEVECRTPEGLSGTEEEIRAMVARAIRRGRVRVSVSLKARPQAPSVVFQKEVARRYVLELKKLQRELKLPGEISLNQVLGLPQVMVAAQATEVFPGGWEPAIRSTVSRALDQAVRMRRREGQRLEKVLARLVESMESLSHRVERRVPAVYEALAKKLGTRIRALAPAADATAAASEAASFVRETDVTEELARIRLHLTALREAAAGQAASPGRTIDFLAQELQREVNTLGVKIRDGGVVRWVVEMKGVIEKLREQAANVE